MWAVFETDVIHIYPLLSNWIKEYLPNLLFFPERSRLHYTIYNVGSEYIVKIRETYALSFYKSQNVLCQSKFFESAQKFQCI